MYVLSAYCCPKALYGSPVLSYTKSQVYALRRQMVLCLQLKRFSFDKGTGPARVISHPVSYKLQETFCNVQYELKAVVFHAGASCNDGHYWAVTQHRTPEGKTWFCHDC